MREILEELGLNKREISIYLNLLKEKISTPTKIAKQTNINRTTVYLDLDNLIQKGLVSSFTKNSKKHFQAVNPNKILEILEEKKEKVKSILPQLKGLYSPSSILNVELFEGKEGVKKVYEDILSFKQDFLVLGATGKSFDILKYYYPHILKKAKDLKIKENCIANFSAKKSMDKHPKEIIEVKYLPKGKNSKTTTIIYSNKIAHLSLNEDKIYIILITEDFLNESYKNYFNTMWSMLN